MELHCLYNAIDQGVRAKEGYANRQTQVRVLKSICTRELRYAVGVGHEFEANHDENKNDIAQITLVQLVIVKVCRFVELKLSLQLKPYNV
jgi:hypothetical protein